MYSSVYFYPLLKVTSAIFHGFVRKEIKPVLRFLLLYGKTHDLCEVFSDEDAELNRWENLYWISRLFLQNSND